LQDNKPNNQSLDDDILQCKADLREMFRTLIRPDSDKPKSAEADIKAVEADDLFLEAELSGDADTADSISDALLLEDIEEIHTSPDPQEPEVDEKTHQLPAVISLKSEDTPKAADYSIAPYLQQLESMKSQRAQLDTHNRQLREKLQQTSRETDSLKFQLAQEQHAREKLQKDLDATALQLQEKSEEFHQQTARIAFLDEQMQNAVSIERANLRLRQEAQALSVQNQQLLAEAEQLKSRPDASHQSQELVQTLRGELQEAEQVLTNKQADLQRMQETLAALQQELSLRQQKEAELSQQLTEKEHAFSNLNASYAEMREALERFRTEKEAALSAVSGQLKESAEQNRQLRDDGEQLRHEAEAFQTQANGEIGLLTEKTALLKIENDGLSEALERLKTENQQLLQAAEELETAKRHLKNSDDEFQQVHEFSQKLRAENESLTAALSQVRGEKEELHARLQAMESAESRLQEDIRQLQETAAAGDSLRHELDAAQQEIDRLQHANRSLQDQLDAIEAEEFVATELDAGDDELLEAIASPAGFREVSAAEENEIPVFNLAEQIMEEHRRSVAGRRQRVAPSAMSSQGPSLENVIRQYIPTCQTHAASPKPEIPGSPYLWTDQSLTPFQQEILQEIVRKDMEFYSHRRFTHPAYSTMNN
jgi:chromosome segregation ATPase